MKWSFRIVCWWLVVWYLWPCVWPQEKVSDAGSREAVQELLLYGRPGSGTFELAQLHRLLLVAHPNDVQLAEVEKRVAWEESLIVNRHLVEGVLFPLRVDGDAGREVYSPISAGDMALYTGFYLAGQTFHYLSTGEMQTLRTIAVTLDGIYKLTHITGVPGMLVRYALPLQMAQESGMVAGEGHTKKEWMHVYYDKPPKISAYPHLRTMVAGVDVAAIETSPALQSLDAHRRHYGDTYYYTRTTRDQMTGIVFGLAIVSYFLDEGVIGRYLPQPAIQPEQLRLLRAIRVSAWATALDIFLCLHRYDWEIQDPMAEDAGTMANDVSELLRLAVAMLARWILMASAGVTPALELESKRQQVAALLRAEDAGLLPPDLCIARNQIQLFRSAGWWSFTWNYYAWSLRAARLFTIVLLDDVPPRELTATVWPLHTVTSEAVAARNRHWLQLWKQKLWRQVYGQSNPWLVLLYNFARRLVLERHYGRNPVRLACGNDDMLYRLTAAEFDRHFRNQGQDFHHDLSYVLFAPIVVNESGYAIQLPSLGLDLPRCHFHLRSLAITPIRTYISPCYFIPRYRWRACKSQTWESVYPPHLITPCRFWSFSEDWRVGPDLDKKPDLAGSEERTMICLPTVYWLARASGQLVCQFDAYPTRSFTPPGRKKE